MAKPNKILRDQIVKLCEQKYSKEEISAILSISPERVRKYIIKLGVNETYKCQYCGEIDISKLHQQIQLGKLIIFNSCKICKGKNISNGHENRSKEAKEERIQKGINTKLEKGTLKKQFYWNNIFEQRLSNLNITYEYLYDLHYNQYKTIFQISKILRVNKDKVRELFNKYGLEEIYQCQFCGERDQSLLCKRKTRKVNICFYCNSSNSRNKNKKIGKSYSKISQELFWKIYAQLPEELKYNCYFAELNYEINEKINKEARDFFKITNYSYNYDFCLYYKNIKFIIEFQGNIYHAHPDFYIENSTPLPFNKNITAQDIWIKDGKKDDYLSSIGHYVTYIWESNYKNNKDYWVIFCLDQIKNWYINLEGDINGF